MVHIGTTKVVAMLTEIVWIVIILGLLVLLFGAYRMSERVSFKTKLKRWWQPRWEKHYNRQLEYYSNEYHEQIRKLHSSGALKLFMGVEDDSWMEAEDKILRELREQQRLDDEARTEWEQAQRRREERAAEFFNYALEHPELPEAERHLDECLDRALEEIEQVRRGMAYEKSQLRLSPRYSKEELSAIARINEYRTEMRKLDERVMQIHRAFESLPATE